jgi:hypothetical protein
MPVVSINELKERFEPGKHLRASYFVNLIDTLADDRTAVHIGRDMPTDSMAVPFWFNDETNTLSVFNGVEWISVSGNGNSYNLPKDDGLPGQVLRTDGNGNVTWQTL